MKTKNSILLAAISVCSAGLLGGCPTDMTGSTADTTGASTTEAPPVAVHNDTSSTDTSTTTGDPSTGTNNDTTTTTISDPNSTSTNTPTDTTTDPNSNPSSTEPPASSISGSFSGTLTWENSQFLAGGDAFPSGTDDVPLTVEFDENGVVKAVYFRGFVDAPGGMADVQQVGDVVTITQCKGSSTTGWQDCALVPEQDVQGTLTQTVRILSVDYGADTATIELRVRHRKTEGQLMESGRGTETISITMAGDTLTYESTMTYDVTLGTTNGGPSIDAGEISTTSGTLQRP